MAAPTPESLCFNISSELCCLIRTIIVRLGGRVCRPHVLACRSSRPAGAVPRRGACLLRPCSRLGASLSGSGSARRELENARRRSEQRTLRRSLAGRCGRLTCRRGRRGRFLRRGFRPGLRDRLPRLPLLRGLRSGCCGRLPIRRFRLGGLRLRRVRRSGSYGRARLLRRRQQVEKLRFRDDPDAVFFRFFNFSGPVFSPATR